jgi:hypothetical protein
MKITRQADGVIRRFGGETFLIPVSGTTAGSSNAFEFNRVAEEIWSRLPLGEAVELGEIVDALQVVFEAGRSTLEADVTRFVQELARLELVSGDGVTG